MLIGNENTYLSPGTYIQEIDLTVRAQVASTITCAMSFYALKGTMKTYFTTKTSAHEQMYGKADPSISFAHDAARAIHEESPQLWNQRVVNGALHAGLTYFVDFHSKNAPAGGLKGRIMTFPFPVGSDDGYEALRPEFWALEFSNDLIASNTFAMSVTNGTDVEDISVVFASNHNSTMASIASAITTALGVLGSGGYAQAIAETTSSTANKYVIAILGPTDTTVSFGDPAITGGVSQADVVMDSDAVLVDVFAENPGVWADDIGVKLTGVDVGVRQRYQVTIGGPLVTGNTISMKINGGTAVTATFDTDSDTTLAAFATALTAHADVYSATVLEVAGAKDNDRSIVIIANESAPAFMTVSELSVTGGASQVAVLGRETLKGVVPNKQFQFEVYNRDNVSLPAERFTATLGYGVSGYGFETALDAQVNLAPGSGSMNVRVVISEMARTYVLQPFVYDNVWTIDKTINWLTGGDDGALPTSAHINTGWDSFANRETIGVRMLVNAGYSDPVVQQYMVALAEFRHDCFAILDVPSSVQDAQSAVDFRTTTININSSFGGLYTPDLLIADPYSNRKRYVPPSGHVAAQFCYSQKVGGIGKAPAGLQRGVLKKVLGLRHNYDIGHRELMSAPGVRINPIILKRSVGAVIWAEYTLQYVLSVLSFVHARVILNSVEAAYADALDYTALFENNVPSTRYKVTKVGETALQPFKDAEFLEDYDIICNNDNNPPSVRNRDMIIVDMLMTIARVNNQVLLRAVLTPAGAQFSVIENQVINQATS